MNKMQDIEIKLSKKKLILLFLAGVIFVICSILFIINPSHFVSFIIRSEKIILLIGTIGIIIFGIASIFLFLKLFDSKPGLIINEEGITDNTNSSSNGLIRWIDIINIKQEKVMSTKFLLIEVKNPEEYIKRSNKLKRVSLKQNMNTYGTPLTLTSVGLQSNFEELRKTIIDSWEKYKEESV